MHLQHQITMSPNHSPSFNHINHSSDSSCRSACIEIHNPAPVGAASSRDKVALKKPSFEEKTRFQIKDYRLRCSLS